MRSSILVALGAVVMVGIAYGVSVIPAHGEPATAPEGWDARIRDNAASMLAEGQRVSLLAPTPPPGSFDPAAAARGKVVFSGQAKCAACHVPPLFTEPGWNAHTGAEVGIDDFHASRSPTGRYRTAPLSGLFAPSKGGFYHDGRFATLEAVVDHYDRLKGLGLDAGQKRDLVEYLKSL